MVKNGVKSDGKGSYYVTDWSAGNLYKIKKNGRFDVLSNVSKNGAADHEVLIDKNLILIPIMTEGKVVALKIN